jgi:hypothetical protein
MPIPLGVLAVAGAGAAGAAGAYELLETVIVPSGGQASVTFSNLNSSYGSTYQHLQIRAVVKTTAAERTTPIQVNINGSTATNTHRLQGTGAAVQAITGEDRVGLIAGATTSNVFGAAIIDILDAFETTKNKTIRSLTGVNNGTNAGENMVTLASGYLNSTSTTSSLVIDSSSGDWAEGSRISLYGMRSS